MKRALVLSSVVSVSVGCGTAGNSGYTLVVGGDDGGNEGFVVGDASGARDLDAYIEQGQVAVKLITLSCAGDCATVQAVGTGGNAPYSYAWENGSTNPVRRVCPASDTAYAVKVTDTAKTGEVPRPSQTVETSVTASVLACPDGSGAASDSGLTGGDAGPSCDFGSVVGNATNGNVAYFEDGGSLPPGRYHVKYVDGCMKYGGAENWTVQAFAPPGGPGISGYYLVGATSSSIVVMLPGTSAPVVSPYTQFQDCVTANAMLASVDFTFDGGPIGVWLLDSPYDDNVAGENGKNPEWDLTLEAACPPGLTP